MKYTEPPMVPGARCFPCGGRGKKPEHYSPNELYPPPIEPRLIDCRNCNGRGYHLRPATAEEWQAIAIAQLAEAVKGLVSS